MIESLVLGSAARWPDRVAVVDGDRQLTFAQLGDRVSRLANALIGLGLEPGDRVLDVQLNSHTYVESDLACALAGVVRVPVNTRLSEREVLHIAGDSGARGLFIGPEFGDLGATLADVAALDLVIGVGGAERNGGGHGYEDLLARARPAPPGRSLAPADLVAIHYSSGTTGAPKGCMRTVRNRLASAGAVLTGITGRLTPEDACLHAGPLTHASGLFMLPHLASGSKQVLMRKFDVERVPELIREQRVTSTVMVPTMVERLCAEVERLGPQAGGRLRSLRRVAYAGAPMPPERIAAANEILGGRLVQFYGMVEAIPPLAVLQPEDHGEPGLLRSAGRPVLDVSLRIVDEEGRPAGPGEPGELLVGGDHVMAGYWSNAEATTKSLRDGWLRSGDIASSDERGYLYLLDRRADMIISGGFNVMPREIEEVLSTHGAVREVAVVGVPDRDWGEAVVACVVAESPGPDLEAELRRLCAERVAAFKKPKRIEFLDALPRNPTGKLSRKLLRDRLAGPGAGP